MNLKNKLENIIKKEYRKLFFNIEIGEYEKSYFSHTFNIQEFNSKSYYVNNKGFSYRFDIYFNKFLIIVNYINRDYSNNNETIFRSFLPFIFNIKLYSFVLLIHQNFIKKEFEDYLKNVPLDTDLILRGIKINRIKSKI